VQEQRDPPPFVLFPAAYQVYRAPSAAQSMIASR